MHCLIFSCHAVPACICHHAKFLQPISNGIHNIMVVCHHHDLGTFFHQTCDMFDNVRCLCQCCFMPDPGHFTEQCPFQCMQVRHCFFVCLWVIIFHQCINPASGFCNAGFQHFHLVCFCFNGFFQPISGQNNDLPDL